jgi:hypothetical protein
LTLATGAAPPAPTASSASGPVKLLTMWAMTSVDRDVPPTGRQGTTQAVYERIT